MKEKEFNGRPFNKERIEDLILGKGNRTPDRPEHYDSSVEAEMEARAQLEAMGL